MSSEFVCYAIQQSDAAKQSRKELPREALLALFDVLDKLAENPNAFPGARSPSAGMGASAYTHPNPALQVTFELLEETRVYLRTSWHRRSGHQTGVHQLQP
jgi:hypothetical protein